MGYNRGDNMAAQVFYRKWRPHTLTEVVGQETVTRTLRNALSSGQVSHAYIFYGPRGTGKTSTGRILAKAVNCLTDGDAEPCNTCSMCQAMNEGRALDVIEIDAASNRGIDDIRDLCEKVNYAPNQARYKVYIIDEVHMLTKEASNALLKTLEEPPPHVIFILATTEINKVLPTILSRCQRFDFRRISQADIVAKLSHICAEEGIQVDPEGLWLVARSAAGSLRDAENLLEQLTTYYGTEVGLDQVRAILGISGDMRTRELTKHIVNNDISAGIAAINGVNRDGLDLAQFNRELVEYLRGLLLVKTGSSEAGDFTAEEVAELKVVAAGASLPHILKAVKLFGQLEFSFDNYSTLPLELALVECVLPSEEKEAIPIRRPEVKHNQPKPQKVEAPVADLLSTPPANLPAAPPRKEASPAQAEALTPLPVVATAAQVGTGSEIEKLQRNWKQIINEAPPNVKKTGAVAILRSAGIKPVAIEGDTVVLASKFDFYKEQIEKPENQRIAATIISSFLARSCQVRCISQPEDNHLVEAALKMGAQIIDVEEK
ncbi:DNA polymerase III subunit gamma/tau [Chloroflexota bacterium]